jgi:hypothetical protein
MKTIKISIGLLVKNNLINQLKKERETTGIEWKRIRGTSKKTSKEWKTKEKDKEKRDEGKEKKKRKIKERDRKREGEEKN